MLEIVYGSEVAAPSLLLQEEIDAVTGGVSIYVDGSYWGEGTFDYWPWPGGRSMTGAPVVFR
jgi:hypothetical protein